MVLDIGFDLGVDIAGAQPGSIGDVQKRNKRLKRRPWFRRDFIQHFIFSPELFDIFFLIRRFCNHRFTLISRWCTNICKFQIKCKVRVDSAKFHQARCAAKLKRVGPALDDFEIAFEYHPIWRVTLQAELAQPNNDWAILQGNWYRKEVLLRKR